MIDIVRVAAIIGTAGRRKDGERLNETVYKRMLHANRTILTLEKITHASSGGAAYADHTLVDLGLEGFIPPENITLHLPAPFENGKYLDEGFRSPGGTANYYHECMSKKLGKDTLAEIGEIIRRGAKYDVSYRGFKARNTLIADDASFSVGIGIAHTFGSSKPWTIKKYTGDTTAEDAGLNEAGTGTIDTWNKLKCTKYHACLG